jgi:enoyl-CoA hydratase
MTTMLRPTAPVRVSAVNQILVITLNRPAARNAINKEVARVVAAALDRLEADTDLRLGVITGAGPDFCAGMDLKAFVTEGFPFIGGHGLAGVTRRQRSKPLIAAVEGHAVAGGCEIALACDLIVASADARFGLPEVCRGLIASEGGAVRLAQRVPYHVAMHMLLTGDPITAAEAARYGLVNSVVPAGQALTGALDLAARIMRNAPLAVAATCRIVADTASLPEAAAFAVQDARVVPVAASQDAVEGALAFAQKRPPQWQGR